MKTILCAIIVGLLVGCSNQKDQAAITTVLSARIEARQALSSGPVVPARARYLQRLKAISTVDCPQDFQAAWFDYVEAWDRIVSHPLGREFAVLEEVGSAKGGPALAQHGVSARDRMDNDERWREVCRVALKHGVQTY